jgi:hypothetical protein
MNQRHFPSAVLSESSLLESLYQDLRQELARLLAEPEVSDCWPQARAMLEALPLSTGEYAAAVNRLRSAQRYATQRQLGAARFELNQLARKLVSISKNHGER